MNDVDDPIFVQSVFGLKSEHVLVIGTGAYAANIEQATRDNIVRRERPEDLILDNHASDIQTRRGWKTEIPIVKDFDEEAVEIRIQFAIDAATEWTEIKRAEDFVPQRQRLFAVLGVEDVDVEIFVLSMREWAALLMEDVAPRVS